MNFIFTFRWRKTETSHRFHADHAAFLPDSGWTYLAIRSDGRKDVYAV